jgi:chemotaxis protein MotB
MRKRHTLDNDEKVGGHDGGGMMRWLLTYADMLTLLFALFIVMYGLAQIESCGKLRQLQQNLNDKFHKPYAFNFEIPRIDERIPIETILRASEVSGRQGEPIDDMAVVTSKLLTELNKDEMSRIVEMHLVDRGLVMSLLTDKLLFDKGDAELKACNTLALQKIAGVLAGDTHEIRVEGHTCDLPLMPCSRFKNNWELSTIRAANVAQFIINAAQMDPSRVSIIGYGEFRPLFPNNGEDNRMRNRRVDIILLRKGERRGHPFPHDRLSPPVSMHEVR